MRAKYKLPRVTIELSFTHKTFHVFRSFRARFGLPVQYIQELFESQLTKIGILYSYSEIEMYISLSIFLTVSYAGFTHAQTWYYPDPTIVPTFNNIDVINASWSIPATSFSTNLWLWCTPNGTMSYTLGTKAICYPCGEAG